MQTAYIDDYPEIVEQTSFTVADLMQLLSTERMDLS